MTEFYDPARAAQVALDAHRALGRLIDNMRSKAGQVDNPDTSFLLEVFANDLDGVYNKISVDLLPLL